MGLSTAKEVVGIQPWYKQGWPWFIISIPAVSVVLGINMFYLAHQTNNSLVVDDYYKQGKSISQFAERDRAAATLRLSARVVSNNEGIKLHLSQSTNAERLRLPETLALRWVHVTQSHKDGSTTLQHFGGGRYFDNSIMLPETGRWRILVEPVSGIDVDLLSLKNIDWRLLSDRVTLSTQNSVTIGYRE